VHLHRRLRLHLPVPVAVAGSGGAADAGGVLVGGRRRGAGLPGGDLTDIAGSLQFAGTLDNPLVTEVTV
jgi:hypothetical protein